MTTQRKKQQILDYIKDNPTASRSETARKFKVSEATVARHRRLSGQSQPQNDTAQLLEKTRHIKIVQPASGSIDSLTKLHIDEYQPAGCIADSVRAQETVVENNYPVAVECVRECTWQKKLWQVGELATVDNSEVPEHFRLYDPACPVNPFLSVEELLAAVGHTRKTQQSYWG